MAPKRETVKRKADPAPARSEQAPASAAASPVLADGIFKVLIAAAPFPAFMLDRNRVAAANAMAQPILAAFGSDATWGDAPLARIVQLAGAGRPAQTRVAVRRAEDPMAPPNAYDVTVLPVAPLAFVTARDVTFDVNLGKALTQSRALYRDLIECSADFAFETDAGGVFSFVSPRGALGYAASSLHGRLASDLCADGDGPGTFSAHHAQDSAFATVRDAAGQSRTLRITSRPVLDEYGVLARVRGVARDVTAEHACLKELEALRARLAVRGQRPEPDGEAPC
ncbi:MAG TPA: PAS domain S-box protein [Micropepsaceae bacterium]|nr:PAS domain S-box protein [Micropepsaceae bacterium]